MLLRSCNTTELVQILFDFWVNEKSMYALLLAAICDCPFTLMSDMGIAVGISLQSFKRAEIYVLFHLLPATGRHLEFDA